MQCQCVTILPQHGEKAGIRVDDHEIAFVQGLVTFHEIAPADDTPRVHGRCFAAELGAAVDEERAPSASVSQQPPTISAGLPSSSAMMPM